MAVLRRGGLEISRGFEEKSEFVRGGERWIASSIKRERKAKMWDRLRALTLTDFLA